MRIIVIDDSKVARTVVKKILADIGYDDIEEASDGIEGIQALSKGAFDLIICDWNMPNLDGLGFVKAVQQSPKRDVPVLMVSSESYLSRIVDIMRAGAQGYIRKPFRADRLRAKIVEVMKKVELDRKSKESNILAGSLTEIGFPELIQFLASGQRDGELQLDLGGQIGTVEFAEGAVLDARLGALRGEEAFFAIAAFEEGTFRFQHRPTSGRRAITAPTMTLLMESMKRRDEREEENQPV